MESKEPKPKNGDDNKEWEDIKESNQITTNDSNLSKINQEIQNEQAELSEIETGSKGQPDFDEMISFNHTYLNYRIARCFTTREQLTEATFGLLMTNVFIYSGDAIDINYMENLPNSEGVKNIRKKINSYKDDDESQKITFLENVSFYVKTVGFQDTAESILPILSDLPKEKESLVERFFNDFTKFVDEIVKFGDKAYFILKDHMISLIGDIFSNTTNINILKSVSDGLVYMTKYMKDEDKGDNVLKIVIQMAQEDENEQKKEIAINLFGRLAPLVGSELIASYIVPQINFFSNDPSFKVRKEVASQLKNICDKIDQPSFKKRLLPIYKNLSSDSAWQVKKVAAEILPEITKLCDTETITKDLLPLFKSFVQDEKSQVRNIAIEIFGEFISLINKTSLDNFSELLEFYVNTIIELSTSKKENKLIIQKCAYNFPAVLSFFGAEAWPKLKPCFVKMANEKDEKIKMPLGASMGEISKLLGSELTESDLLEYVDKFFKSSSQNSELKIKILTALPDIIKNINSNKKNSYLEFIKYMIGNKDDKWRKRVTYCKIIGKFNGTYTDNIIYKRVFPIAINFCFDDVSRVRSISARKNSRLILQLITGKEEYRDKTMKIIQSFAQSINFRYRQLFIYMCKHLFENEEVFKTYISELLLDLAYDKITNVRIILAQFISDLIAKEKYSQLKKNETIRKIIKILRNDNNLEIKSIIDKITDVEDIDVELNKEVNHKFKDLMKFVSSEFGITKNVPLYSKFMEKKNQKTENPIKETSQETPGETKDESNNASSSEEKKENITKEKTKEKTEEKVEEKKEEISDEKNENKKEEKIEEKKDEKSEEKKEEIPEGKKEDKSEEKPQEQ
jgi:serine/threonine-protein phosphatase 4 regulatory subunit 1